MKYELILKLKIFQILQKMDLYLVLILLIKQLGFVKISFQEVITEI